MQEARRRNARARIRAESSAPAVRPVASLTATNLVFQGPGSQEWLLLPVLTFLSPKVPKVNIC